MNWTNVRLILAREVRDQLRDRRTMFMVAVLPLLLYPLLGMGFFQITQFTSAHQTRVLVLGADELDSLDDFPKLLDGDHFAPDLFAKPSDAKLLDLTIFRRQPKAESQGKDIKSDKSDSSEGSDTNKKASESPSTKTPSTKTQAEDDDQELIPGHLTNEKIEQDLRNGIYQAVVEIPPGFGKRMIQFREELASQIGSKPSEKEAQLNRATWESLSPIVRFNSSNDRSQITHARLRRVLDDWRNEVVEQNLRYSHVPQMVAAPFQLTELDVAIEGGARAATWAKILPFIVLIWALVGAFYPAVDLCAGEKERGTLETLLSSPAERSEIVWGKLFTVMLFSVANAVLNLLAMSTTGVFVIKQLPKTMPPEVAGALAAPPLSAFGWLLLGLLPVAALFSALSLALASLARSSKEGQYYLMPLVLVVTPLMFLPLTVGFELNLGNSLIPITGVMLLLRSLLEGNYAQAAIHAPIVITVTLGCCWMAVRWAVDQFNKESVLFRESERLDLGLWVKHLVRDRRSTPSVAMALACFVLILLIKFFMTFALSKMPMNAFSDVATMLFISQVVVIALPAMLMTIMLTSRPWKTLLLDRFDSSLIWVLPLTLFLAVVWHPVNVFLGEQVNKVYPMAPELQGELARTVGLLFQSPSLWFTFLLMALLPAICEEFTFRGFILSGLRHLGHKWWSIVLTAIFFGVVHGVLQQSLLATLTGCILGYLAVQTGSLLPCILFHLTHNSLALLLQIQQSNFADLYETSSVVKWVLRRTVENGETAFSYDWPLVLICVVVTLIILRLFSKLRYEKTEEESLQDALAHQAAPPTLIEGPATSD